jgi:hypothetical protein
MYVPNASAATVIDEVSFQRVKDKGLVRVLSHFEKSYDLIEFSIKPISQNMPSWSACHRFSMDRRDVAGVK